MGLKRTEAHPHPSIPDHWYTSPVLHSRLVALQHVIRSSPGGRIVLLGRDKTTPAGYQRASYEVPEGYTFLSLWNRVDDVGEALQDPTVGIEGPPLPRRLRIDYAAALQRERREGLQGFPADRIAA